MPDSNITKRALAYVMKELMEEEPFSKISVGQICEKCGLNRKSFYYHFRDKYDLVNWIFYTEFFERLLKHQVDDEWEFLEEMCTYFYQNKKFYLNAIEVTGQNSFTEYFSEIVQPILFYSFADTIEEDENRAFYTEFLIDSLMCSIIKWLRGNSGLTPEEYVALLKNVAVNGAKKFIES